MKQRKNTIIKIGKKKGSKKAKEKIKSFQNKKRLKKIKKNFSDKKLNKIKKGKNKN